MSAINETVPIAEYKSSWHFSFKGEKLRLLAIEVSEAAKYAILGFGLTTVMPSVSPALFTFAATYLSIRLILLAIKITYPYNIDILNTIRHHLNDLITTYPKLQIITYIFAITLTTLWQSLGCVCAGILGVFNAVIIDMERCRQLKEIRQETMRIN